IRYFTALVDGRKDPATPGRQQTYLRALETIPNLTVHYGSFVTHPKTLPLEAGGGMARVLRTDEKGSDVNLASHVLLDAFAGDFETALVVSNDSDLAFPIRAVRKRLGLVVGVACPVAGQSRPSRQLVEAADFRFHLTRRRRRLLRDSQFPDRLVDSAGQEIRKPAG
ncbi:MAG: NYN domain-containing protein, partial [Chloroflexi bacterium]|nr:NYN domain-containing protein [Chloroflexota bacterium]